MKKSETHSLPYVLEDTYILQFGTFYFYETFVVAEIQDKVSFDKKMAQMVIELIDSHYEKGAQIGYITNKIHNYSIKASAWYKFFEIRYRLKGYAVVNNKKPNPIYCALRKLLYKSAKCEYNTILEAASWLTSLHVLKKNEKQLEFNSLKNKHYFL
jgi:hypothetical protein